MNRMIALEKNPFLRLAPLFVKDFVLEFADRLAVRETTTTVSNLGRIAIDEQLAPFVRDINVLTSTNGMSFTLCSFADDLSIGISSVYANPDAIKNFCRLFSAPGNPWAHQHQQDERGSGRRPAGNQAGDVGQAPGRQEGGAG